MLLNHSSLEAIHRYCTSNRTLLEQSTSAGCVCCGATFAPGEIREWIPSYEAGTGKRTGETAACPRCGIDSVLPSAAPVTLSPHLLAAMQSYWFGSRRPSSAS